MSVAPLRMLKLVGSKLSKMNVFPVLLRGSSSVVCAADMQADRDGLARLLFGRLGG